MAPLNDAPFFTADLEVRLETRAKEALAGGRRVNAFTAVWHLFLWPIGLFIFHWVLRARFFAGYSGFREALHAAVFLFAVNARIYELTHADPAALERIKKEFE